MRQRRLFKRSKILLLSLATFVKNSKAHIFSPMMIAAAVLFTGAFANAEPVFNARFDHADSSVRSVTIGVTGKVSMNITMTRPDQPAESALLHATSIKGGKGLMLQSGSEKQTHVTGTCPFPIQFPSEDTLLVANITKTGSSWKASFGQDPDKEAVELTIEVQSDDCKVSDETASLIDALTTASTTEAQEETTDSPETTLDGRRLEAKETTPAPETEIPDETEETEETEEEDSSSCDPGFSCDPILKSCQLIKETLPAGSAGKQGSSSSAVQNSSCAILAAMVAYLMI